MTPPFNTGKVLIGSMYQPQNVYSMSSFEYRLQEALLKTEDRADAAFDVVCWIIAMAVFAFLIYIIQ